MVTEPVPGAGMSDPPGMQPNLQEALARLKSATDRQAAVVSVLSRLGVSAQDKRLAQAEGKKADHELREAKRLLGQAQASVQTK